MENLDINISNNEYEDYNIENEINKSVIRNSAIKQVDNIEYPMVCINCAIHTSINKFALEGLRCLIDSCNRVEDDTVGSVNDVVPVYINTKTGVLEVGRASFIKLHRYLGDFVKNCINEKVKVYYMESSEHKELISKSDKSRIILDL